MNERQAEITECIATDFRLEVKAGWEMDDGEPLWTFSLRRDGCMEIRCGWTNPVETMHVCHPAELHRLLGEVIAKAHEDGGFDGLGSPRAHDPKSANPPTGKPE